ncbi:hypothetical protein ACQZV8_01235 [Magnetococcales bacterium HHB-1]
MTTENTIRVGDLPEALRGGYHPDVVVKVSLEPVLTENGFTPEEEEEILQASEDEDGSVSFDNMDAALAYLDKMSKDD